MTRTHISAAVCAAADHTLTRPSSVPIQAKEASALDRARLLRAAGIKGSRSKYSKPASNVFDGCRLAPARIRTRACVCVCVCVFLLLVACACSDRAEQQRRVGSRAHEAPAAVDGNCSTIRRVCRLLSLLCSSFSIFLSFFDSISMAQNTSTCAISLELGYNNKICCSSSYCSFPLR